MLVGLVAHGEWVSSSQRRSGSADWHAQAGCRDRDPDEFTGEDITESALLAARAVCWGCPVMRQCAGYAREIEATWGLWAGNLRTPREPRPRPPSRLGRSSAGEPRGLPGRACRCGLVAAKIGLSPVSGAWVGEFTVEVSCAGSRG